LKTLNYKNLTIEEFIRDHSCADKLAQSLDAEKIRSERWFRRKNFAISRIRLGEIFNVRSTARERIPFLMIIIDLKLEDKSRESYFLPLAFSKDKRYKDSGYAQVRTKEGIFQAIDAVNFPPFLKFMDDCIKSGARFKGEKGHIVFEPAEARSRPWCEHIITNSTNSLVRYSSQSILKIVRKVETGINVEYEMGNFLTRNGFEYSPILEGGINYITSDRKIMTIGIKFSEIHGAKDAWIYTLEHLDNYFSMLFSQDLNDDRIVDFLDAYLRETEELARIVALMHSTLRKDKEDERFSPEKLEPADIRSWEKSLLGLTKAAVDDAQKFVLSNPDKSEILSGVKLTVDLIKRTFDKARKYIEKTGEKTRTHCDFHLGQILKTKDSFVIIDFEGEPLRNASGRQRPLEDCI
jgi:maltose alpha-D-glucosyltransferase/alpha-amylase